MSTPEKDGLDIPPEVAEKLGYYVYLYIDPRDSQIRYVGKGVGTRAIQHLAERKESEKVNWLADLRHLKLKPRIEILARNLASEEEALLVERSVIDAVGIPPLKNAVRGHDTEHGRELLEEIIIRESAEEAVIRHPVLMFRIRKHFKRGMRNEDIYEATRGVWTVSGARRKKGKYALAVYDRIVRGVFCIDEWHKAKKADYSTATYNPARQKWKFSSHSTVPREVMDNYLHKSVRSHFKKGSQNSVAFPPFHP